jgi:hypothetical protein
LHVALATADDAVGPVAEVHERIDDRDQQDGDRDEPAEDVEDREGLDAAAHWIVSVPRFSVEATSDCSG